MSSQNFKTGEENDIDKLHAIEEVQCLEVILCLFSLSVSLTFLFVFCLVGFVPQGFLLSIFYLFQFSFIISSSSKSVLL